MKKTFQFIFLIFCSLFIISGCGGGSVPSTTSNINNPSSIQTNIKFPALGSHYAYVTGNYANESQQISFITRYEISENGDFINPIRQAISDPSHQIFGIAVAPDHHYIYYSFGDWIFKCALNNNGTLSDNCSYYTLTDQAGNTAKPNFLAVGLIYNKLYVTTRNSTNIYSCNIDTNNNDRLYGCVIATSFNGFNLRSTQGIAVSSSDGTVFVNATFPRNTNYLFVCGINHDDGSISQCQSYATRISGDQFPGGMTYVQSQAPGTGILTIANMGTDFFGAQCPYTGNLALAPCTNLNRLINYQFAGRTFDVAWNPINHAYLYFTSGNDVLKWRYNPDQIPVSMPLTRGTPSYAINIF